MSHVTIHSAAQLPTHCHRQGRIRSLTNSEKASRCRRHTHTVTLSYTGSPPRPSPTFFPRVVTGPFTRPPARDSSPPPASGSAPPSALRAEAGGPASPRAREGKRSRGRPADSQRGRCAPAGSQRRPQWPLGNGVQVGIRRRAFWDCSPGARRWSGPLLFPEFSAVLLHPQDLPRDPACSGPGRTHRLPTEARPGLGGPAGTAQVQLARVPKVSGRSARARRKWGCDAQVQCASLREKGPRRVCERLRPQVVLGFFLYFFCFFFTLPVFVVIY